MSPKLLRDYLNRLEAHAAGEAAHGERVAVMSTAIADRIGIGGDELCMVRYAAALHDIGKLLISQECLQSEEPLAGQQILEIREHCAYASEILGNDLPEEAKMWITHHHERWDGAGYPSRLSGEHIPLISRIISVAEAFDAMTAPAYYRSRKSEDGALEEIRRCAGTQFDPSVISPFLEVQPLIQPLY